MSVSDVFITDAEASDLKLMDGMEGMLHHPFQMKRSIPGSNRMDVRVVNFNNPNFGQRNDVQIPSMDLVPHEMYVQFTLTGETSGGSVVKPGALPLPTWLSQQGADLNFKEVSIYNLSEAECLMSTILDEEQWEITRKFDDYGFDQYPLSAGNVVGKAENPQILYLPLNVLCDQVLSKVGPLSAYASNDWSVSVDLRQRASCFSALGAAAIANISITSMRLVILGSKAPVGEVALAREALSKNGIVWNFLRSNHVRSTLADNSGSSTVYTQQYSSIVGSVSHARLLIRNKTAYDSTNAQVVNSTDYQVYEGTGDLISVGKTSNPFEVWGQAIPQKFARNFFPSRSTKNGSVYIGALPTNQDTNSDINTGIFDIAFAESEADLEFGTSTGSYPVKNDLQIELTMGTDTVQDNYLDTVIYTHVRGVITSGIANVNLSA